MSGAPQWGARSLLVLQGGGWDGGGLGAEEGRSVDGPHIGCCVMNSA
jgi:hypothetical protein